MSATGNRKRPMAARLAIFAVLFQAILFGWHHHPLALAQSRPHQAAAVQNSINPAQPAVDEDGCEICQVLHHQSAAPAGFAAAPLPLPAAAILRATEPEFVSRAFARAFQARAPPLA